MSVDGLRVEAVGPENGTGLLLIHGAVMFEGCRPLLEQPRLTERWRLLHYYRRGYAGSASAPAGFTIADQAGDARSVLREKGIEKAHVLGHSLGALIAMQLAIDAPDLVRSTILVEPVFASRAEVAVWFQEALGPIADAYAAGDRYGASDRMLRLVDGPGYGQMFDAVLPSGWRHASASAVDVYFQVDLPAGASWRFGTEQAGQIVQPTLIVKGSSTLAQFGTICGDLAAMLPGGELAVVPGATHNVIASNPGFTAGIIRKFLLTVENSRG